MGSEMAKAPIDFGVFGERVAQGPVRRTGGETEGYIFGPVDGRDPMRKFRRACMLDKQGPQIGNGPNGRTNAGASKDDARPESGVGGGRGYSMT